MINYGCHRHWTRLKMLPPAVRWLCLLLLTVRGIRAQLSVGDADSFLLEDLEPIDTTAQPDDAIVGEGPNAALATELPPADATFVGLEDAVTSGGDITPETINALEDLISDVGEFGSRITSDAVEDGSADFSVPQLTRRILVSGTLPSTTVVPEASASFTHPSSVVRVLSELNSGWLPNWPSELLHSNGVARRPTIRFPSDSPFNDLESTPTIIEEVSASAAIPSIVPSLVVSKVPVTQYFFDLTSAALTLPPGPLFDPEELNLSASVTSGLENELSLPALDLSSSIPELQSSAFIPAAELITVTPTLPGPDIYTSTEDFLKDNTTINNIPVGTPVISSSPTVTQSNFEVVNNKLGNKNNITTLTIGDHQEVNPESSEPQPSNAIPDDQGQNDASDSTTDGALVHVTSSLSSPDPNAELPVDSTGTGAPQTDPSTTSSSPQMIESDLALILSPNILGTIKPTSVRQLLAANTSRTPLWMRLSISVPTQPSISELLLSSPTSPIVSIHTKESISLTGVAGEASTNTDLVSSLLVSSQTTRSHIELTTFVDNALTKPSVKDFTTSLTLVDKPQFTNIPSIDLTQPSISVSHTTGNIVLSKDQDSTSIITPLSVPVDGDIVQLSDFLAPTDHINAKNDSTVESHEFDAGVSINATVDYHESLEDPLIFTVAGNHPLQYWSSSAVDKDSHIATADVNTWASVLEFGERPTDIQLIPSYILATATSSLNLVTPVFINGFMSVISETKSTPESHNELMPENTNTSYSTATTTILASTSAPAESFILQLGNSPTLLDPSLIKESRLIFQRVSPYEHSQSEELLVSSVIITDGLGSSNLLLSTITFPESIGDPTSVLLRPSINASVLSSESLLSINLQESGTMSTDLEPSMMVPEIISSFSVIETKTLSSSLHTLRLASESIDVLTESSVLSMISLSIATPTFPEESFSSSFLPFPTTSFSFPNRDLSSLVTPTVTKETSDVLLPDEPQVQEGETATKDAPSKEVDNGNPESDIIPDETFTLTSSSIPTSISATTENDITTKVTDSTTSFPTTPQSAVSVAIMYPTESMPTLTTSMTFPNGTEVVYHLPYVRALVAYNEREFCTHRHNFRAMLAEWISKHLQVEKSVLPTEIEFFNMPQCELTKPTPDDPFNHSSDNIGGNLGIRLNDKMNASLDGKEVTNVYFYVTSSGKINPNLTENFPLFPMELDISEELTYLRAKVSQLELVRPDGSTDSAPLPEEAAAMGTSLIVIIVIVTIVGVIIITALIFFMVVKRKGTTNNYYGRRCTPVSMDAYSMDSVSVYHSFRRKSKRRASGRSVKSYLNQAFDDPSGPSRPLNFAKLTHFISDIDGVHEEFATIPVNMPKYDELPAGVEDKNRYANVIPVPETRVLLKGLKDSPNSEYINANYVRGPRNESKYYISTQAPLEDTVADFWRMIWEHETRVVVMLTDFVEKGIDKCADYLPPSETLDCHRLYGDFQVTLKSRDMREKYVVSNVQLKNLENNLVREIAHMWFTGWPASGVPNEETAFISYILDIRRTRKKLRAKGPILVHCSPGTGRSGTFIACDLVMRQFEEQRNVDVPRTVYAIRRDRAGSVQTKEQYAFIYRVINLYASKLTTGNLDSL